MKNVVCKILNYLKKNQYLTFFSISLLILDFYLRFVNRTMKSFSVKEFLPNAFTFVWVLTFCTIIYLIKNKRVKIIVSITFELTFFIMFATNLIFSRIYSKFFSFKDIVYASEGSEFLYTILGYIKVIDIIVVIISILFICLSIYSYKYIVEEDKKTRITTVVLLVIFIIIGHTTIQLSLGKASAPNEWSAFSNKRNIYNQFNDTKRSLMLCGLYEYTLRDFYLTFINNKKVNYDKYYSEITKYIKNNKKTKSHYNGIFEDKNLIFVMLENIDTWMIDEKSMPTLNRLKNEGINFTNHYSANYASGFTFNSEFIANTGIIPNIKALRTAYSYNQNNYDYALANLFKNKGYIVNSVHKNKGSFYNRDNMHLAWGYSNHYDYSKLETNGENIDLDTTVVSNNIDKFIYEDKFMTFYITYSAHMPFNYTKPECIENLEYIKSNYDSENEEYLCSMSQAKNTDDAITILIDELKAQKKLKNTVLIFFGDHYSYSIDADLLKEQKKESDRNLLTKTPFIIYDGGKHKKEIAKVNSTLDILPTIADLFGLDYNPNVYSGYSVFDENYKGLVVFSDKSWYDGNVYYKSDTTSFDNEYIINNNKYVDEVLTIGGKIVESDYFRKYKIDSIK